MDPTQIAALIDHTLLKPEATPQQVRTLCNEAREYRFKTVCVNSGYTALASECLADSGVGVCTVVGFPLGAMSTAAKAAETQAAIADGATEIDMGVQQGYVAAADWSAVQADIAGVLSACAGTPLKVIFETSALNDDQVRELCAICTALDVAFVKSSTGFGSGGANTAVVQLMRNNVPAHMGVKASGGVRDLESARAMVEAGATRLGTSSGVAIMQGLAASGDY